MPDLFVGSGAIEWVKDPAARPNLFGSLPHYVGEGIILGQYIAESFAGQKLGLMRQNDDFGGDGIDGIRRGVGDSLEIVGEEFHEAIDVDLNAQVDRLRAADADVIAIWATPRQFSTAIKHARLDLNWDVLFVLTQVTGNELSVALSGPEVLEGTVSVTYVRQGWEVDNPEVAKHLEIIREYAGIENAAQLNIFGQYYAELMVEALEIARKNLTRQKLIEAIESIENFPRCAWLRPP